MGLLIFLSCFGGVIAGVAAISVRTRETPKPSFPITIKRYNWKQNSCPAVSQRISSLSPYFY
jgi:hypothetical protein